LPVACRQATAGDLEAIAGLHADSWMRNYRGAYSDAFLDSEVVAERAAVWGERLAQPRPGHLTLVAVVDGAVRGFAHAIGDEDPTWGALLDNLHVNHRFNRLGIGARLLAETAREVIARGWLPAMHLWVLEQNVAAQAFYEAQGGRRVERVTAGPFPGGGYAPAFRYAWPDIATLSRREGGRPEPSVAAGLEAIPLFARLSADERARVAGVSRAVQLDVGQVVVHEGEFAFDFYAIKQGAAEVKRGGERVAVLGAGDFFGEIGVVPNDARRGTRRRGASVIATAPTEAIVIDGSDLRRLTADIPALREAIRATAERRSGS
jgi:ribosomal protein S18 acetylase RimI-like enzyme